MGRGVGPISGHLACPKPHFGPSGRQTCDLAASAATWLQLPAQGHVSQVHSPTFGGFRHLRMAQTHPWTLVGAVLDLKIEN